MDRTNYYKMLIESLRLISASAEVQENSFQDDVHIPDEIALTFSETFLLVEQDQESLNIKSPIFQKLEKIENYFDMLSGEDFPEFWTSEAMKNDKRWQNLRNMGTEILDLLNEPKNKPDLFWIKYITE